MYALAPTATAMPPTRTTRGHVLGRGVPSAIPPTAVVITPATRMYKGPKIEPKYPAISPRKAGRPNESQRLGPCRPG